MSDQQPIIVKKIKKSGGAHHGGAWKVAYADFVTAMMAFFLLLWLLNISTDDARKVISSYFDPSHPKVSKHESGSGGVLGGLTMTKEGAMAEQAQPISAHTSSGHSFEGQEASETTGSNKTQQEDIPQNELAKLEEQLRQQENERFEKAKAELEKALEENKDLAELAKHLKIDITPEGLRIQIIDQEGAPMFPLGSAEMYDKTKRLIAKVAEVITGMPNDISVRGHTDAKQYGAGATYTNWELSSDRANSSRRVLLDNKVSMERLNNVMGKAATDPYIKEDPYNAQNRRITILLLRESLTDAMERGAFGNPAGGLQQKSSQPIPDVKDYERTQGDVFFP